MVRLAVSTAILALLSGSFALAQGSTPKVQAFGGYSILLENKGGLTDLKADLGLHDPSASFQVNAHLYGWNAEAQYNANRWIGLALDAGGHTGNPFSVLGGSASGLPTESRYAILLGPVLSYRSKMKITPYVHALFGWERAHLNATTITGPGYSNSALASSYIDFAMGLGGVVDYKLLRHFSLRLGQLDWYRTNVNLSKFYIDAFNSQQFEGLSTRQRNWRVSTGVVVNF